MEKITVKLKANKDKKKKNKARKEQELIFKKYSKQIDSVDLSTRKYLTHQLKTLQDSKVPVSISISIVAAALQKAHDLLIVVANEKNK